MKTGFLVSAVAALVLGATAGLAQQGPTVSGGMFLERFDTDGDGAVTQAEIDALRAARFAEADADGDGFLTEAEIAAHAEARRDARIAERRAAMAGRMLGRMDADGDGRLSADEAAQGGRLPVFARLDADGNGAITAEEMAQMRGRMAERGRDHDRGHGKGMMRGEGHGHGRGEGGMPWWLR